MPTLLRRSARSAKDLVVNYLAKFGIVGLAGYVVDLGTFNLLLVGTGSGPLVESPFVAKTVSVSLAMAVTWFGNRFWTFRKLRRRNVALEIAEFTAVALVGMGISLACLYVSRHLLGFESLFADNIAANVVGLGLGTAFRLVMYRFWVYGDHRADRVHSETSG